MVKTVARLVTGCLIMKSCHVCIRWLKRFLISYEKDGTLSIYLSHNSLMCITLNPFVPTKKRPTLNKFTSKHAKEVFCESKHAKEVFFVSFSLKIEYIFKKNKLFGHPTLNQCYNEFIPNLFFSYSISPSGIWSADLLSGKPERIQLGYAAPPIYILSMKHPHWSVLHRGLIFFSNRRNPTLQCELFLFKVRKHFWGPTSTEWRAKRQTTKLTPPKNFWSTILKRIAIWRKIRRLLV